METSSPKSTPPPTNSPSSPNPLKRKEPPEDREEPSPSPPTNGLPEGATLADGEYSSGHVVCDFCGTSVPFRDEQTDAFTTKIWDDHRIACGAQAPPAGDAIIYTPESTAEALAHPPAKRRRAKRSEDERIEYLRADPYVAKFEAYRVLCASCDKWIRLRPNSTYCSIPWDAHRKSCLAKKINSKNIYALEERNTLLSKDPDVRKFDAERVLCNMCDRWITVNPDDHLQAVQKWLEHRASCQKAISVQQASLRDPAPVPHAADHPKAGPSSVQSPTTPTSITSPISPEIASISTQPTLHLSQPQSPSSFHDLNPANYAPAHESRRRNAEQRAATLRADTLIGEVEPNRVFCSLCQKWVQLRQDSSYCAYPWLQHRGKCLARHQRRAQKANEIARLKARKQHPAAARGSGQDELISDNEAGEELESEDGADSQLEEDRRRMDARQAEHDKGKATKPRYMKMARISIPYHERNRSFYHNDSRTQPSTSHSHPHPHPHSHGHPHPNATQSSPRVARPWKVEEIDDDADADGDPYVEEEPHPHRSVSRAPVRRPWPTGLADLDSPSGRKQFIFSSVNYLFTTTYESSDDLSISALLTYLNAAVPLDKHEDFDTSEVIKAVAALQDKGRIRFEGDMLRLVE